MKEFFGFGGYTRPAEGFLSWQHITFVTTLLVAMMALAVILGNINRKKDDKIKNRVLIISAILIDAVELFKIIIFYARSTEDFDVGNVLPFFLCSLQLITIPLAAFTKGRIKEASLDFVFIFGMLGAVLGTYGAGQNYSAYPVLCIDNVASGITHCISGFASLYIAVSGMASMRRKNIHITFSILGVFSIVAYAMGIVFDKNYMFLFRGDGTPYDIFFNLVKGNPIAYPIIVIMLFIVYISIFYTVYFFVTSKKRRLVNSMLLIK